ncbi:MAG: hypothetical protein AB7O04_04655 [Hyphomonadaceae bacterium]
MTRQGFWIRMAVSMALDLLDFTFGRVPVLGMAGEGAGALIAVLLWGPAGLIYLGELADMTEQIDGFLPTATLIGLYVGWRQGFLFQKPGATPPART